VGHLERWVARSRRHDDDMARIAGEARWPRDAIRSLAVTRAMYTRLPEGARLWVAGDRLVPIDRNGVAAAFA